MDPTAMMNPMGFGPGMVGGMGPGFGVGPRGFGEKVFPVVRLRGQKKFDGLDALTKAIHQDIETAKHFFAKPKAKGN